jgi:hypothetical protein
MKTSKNKAIFTTVILFFLAIMNNYAQEGEYFINPDRKIEGITIKHKADFSKYKYEYTILDSLGYSRIYKRGIINTSGVRERFITSLDELDIMDKDALIIPFTGREADGFNILPDGLYEIWLYETNKNNKSEENKYLYKVTVDTRSPIFNIQLASKTIHIKNRESLICRAIPVSANEWNVKIQKEGNIIKEQSFKDGDNEINFPGFSWVDYEISDLEDQYFTIFVEAIDRAGNIGIKSEDFVLTNREVNSITMQTIEKVETTTTVYIPKGNFILRPEDYEIYDVKNGDYLAKIAREYYGSAPLWGLIYEINKSKLPNQRDPNLILPRLKLLLPSKELIRDLIDAAKESQNQIE